MFNGLLERLDRAFDAQRQFTADASHELGTPLTVLKSDTQLALQRRRTPEEYEELLRSNLEEIAQLSHVTSDLLLLARCDIGKQHLLKEMMVLNELVTDVCERLSRSAERHKVKLEIASSAPVLVRGDRHALERVVYNLIHNALRYTPAGGRVDVAVTLATKGWARLDVSDTGIGIPPEELPFIFERFHRAANARAHAKSGSGLGLAICRMMATAHGGRVTCTSVMGSGSRFNLDLPAI